MRLLPYPTGRALLLLLVEMIFAVLQLRNAQRDRLGAFARELLHVLQFLPQLLRVRNLRDDELDITNFMRAVHKESNQPVSRCKMKPALAGIGRLRLNQSVREKIC